MGSGLPQIFLLSPLHQGVHSKTPTKAVLWGQFPLQRVQFVYGGWILQALCVAYEEMGSSSPGSPPQWCSRSCSTKHQDHGCSGLVPVFISQRRETSPDSGCFCVSSSVGCAITPSPNPASALCPPWGSRGPAQPRRILSSSPRWRVAVPLEGKRQHETARLRAARASRRTEPQVSPGWWHRERPGAAGAEGSSRHSLSR